MREVPSDEFAQLCKRSGIAIAAAHLGIGRELSYQNGPARTIVVHIAESDFPDTFERTLRAVLPIERNYLLARRHGDGPARQYETSEYPGLIERLVLRPPWLNIPNDDLYLLGGSGEILLVYDHHMSDGLPIFLSSTRKTGLALTLLNEEGPELELYSRADT